MSIQYIPVAVIVCKAHGTFPQICYMSFLRKSVCLQKKRNVRWERRWLDEASARHIRITTLVHGERGAVFGLITFERESMAGDHWAERRLLFCRECENGTRFWDNGSIKRASARLFSRLTEFPSVSSPSSAWWRSSSTRWLQTGRTLMQWKRYE